MHIEAGANSWEWIEDWAIIPDTPSGRENGRTHGVAGASSGDIVVFAQAEPSVLIYDKSGRLKSSWGAYLGAHGLTLVHEDGRDYLWLTDQFTAEVVKATLDGEIVQRIERPDLPIYAEGGYSPTWVAVNEERFGGNGDIWVADGYGSSLVHRYDRDGVYISTLSGREGAGEFNCPHGIAIDTRTGEPELYIADRGNKRIQVYDTQGRYKRVFGEDFLTSPCAFVAVGDLLYVPELRARMTVLDGSDRPVAVIGDNEAVSDIPGWPNHPKRMIEPGKFNSPHGVGADIDGNVYVVEWIVGGRVIKLAVAQ
jgi:hypothetical protein